MIRIAIVGLGRWGKNLLREFNKLATVTICCIKENEYNLKWLRKNYPYIKSTFHYDDILKDKTIDAVVLATPINTHFKLANKTLKAGKHVFVEKPMATSIDDANTLIDMANRQSLTLFVGHVFVYHPILKKIKKIIENEPILYAKFDWNKFGTFGEDIFWNLASHEISIATELFGMPNKISLLDKKELITKADIVSLKLEFNRNRKCIIDINRISNSLNKSITFATPNNLFLWEDDSLYRFNKKKNIFDIIYQSKVSPLSRECKEFLFSIKEAKKPYTDGLHGLNVIRVLTKLVQE